MNAEVFPNLKPDPLPCECGCGAIGRPTKGTGHPRQCSCPRCRGGRNRKAGVSRQRKFAKTAGIPQPKHRSQLGNEESFADPFVRWEIKSGAQVGPILTRFILARDQSEVSRAIGDHRFFAMGAEPTESRLPSVVLVDARDWATHVVPALEACQ